MVETKQATVPEEWAADADAMGVSLSEYVRRMTRAGRRQWGYEHNEEADEPHVQFEETRSSGDEEINTMVRDTIVRNLSTTDGISEEDLAELITAGVADDVSERLRELTREDIVEYDPTKGGWVLIG